MQVLANQNGQLVSVLNDSRNTSASTPVVIQVRVFVRQDLHLVWFQTIGVINDVVACWCDGTLAN